MITPRFSVRQDEARVYITIHAPHVRAQSIEFDVDDDQFKFFASPYYLRLTFPGRVVEDDGSAASFDATTGDISVALSKQTPGESFANLDLLSSLLATRQEREAAGYPDSALPKRPVIEDLDAAGAGTSGGTVDEVLEQARLDEDFDWELPQSLAAEDEEKPLGGSAKYGFNQQYSGYLAHVHNTANEVNEVADPENMTAEERRRGRAACEDAKFDAEYYMSDYVYDDDIQPLIQFTPPFVAALQQLRQAKDDDAMGTPTAAARVPGGDATVDELAHQVQRGLRAGEDGGQAVEIGPAMDFSDGEKKLMMELPRKAHLISDKRAIYLGLVDLLFAYSLEVRINQGESTVESAWTIGALSATLSNLEQFASLRSTVIACFRRGLAYPLYRNWELCEAALSDVHAICRLGRRAILKAFLAMKQLFDAHDMYYIYSKLYFDDYCVWLQTAASDKAIRSMARKLRGFEINKEETGWSLDECEDLALETSEGEDDDDGDREDVSCAEDPSLASQQGVPPPGDTPEATPDALRLADMSLSSELSNLAGGPHVPSVPSALLPGLRAPNGDGSEIIE
ncbi:hypothetical protein LPJ61_000938 [Coemansia biformis]|uniref:CS domain-containing protein n=1 Tax=Coemansia biformis TaxID=1286918 RepID=A0A9W7YFC3_9FUNG|nr:hypothetical protein LPJ61_000938 [Coemansia biformis]